MDNPFDVIVQELSDIKKTLAEIRNSGPKLNSEKEEDNIVGIKEAAKILHLSPDHFYIIHKKHFPIRKPNKKYLFLKSELFAYMNGEIIKPADTGSKEAEAFRIKKLTRKHELAMG
jgi:hypothetical protein